jgi:septal ring-binding cell division protein DamX
LIAIRNRASRIHGAAPDRFGRQFLIARAEKVHHEGSDSRITLALRLVIGEVMYARDSRAFMRASKMAVAKKAATKKPAAKAKVAKAKPAAKKPVAKAVKKPAAKKAVAKKPAAKKK